MNIPERFEEISNINVGVESSIGYEMGYSFIAL